MPKIEDINHRVGAAGPVDYAPVPRNDGFDALGRQAAGARAVLTEIADHDAALEGAAALADFRTARQKRQLELRTSAKDLEGFTDAALADFDEAADALVVAHENPRVQAFLEQRLIDVRAGEEMDSDAWAAGAIIDRRELKTKETVGKLASLLARSPGQYGSVMADFDAAIEASGLPAVNAERARAVGRAALGDAAVDGMIMASPYEARKQLKSGAWDDRGVDVASKLRGVEAEINRREAEARERAAAASAAVSSGLAVQINRFGNGQGEFTQDELDKAKTVLKPSAFNQLQIAFDDARARRATADAERVEVAGLIDAGGTIDPGNAKQVKAYDAYFRNSLVPQIEEQVAALPPEQQAAAKSARVLQFIGQQGVIPETVKGGIRSALRGGTPEQKIEAAKFLDSVKALNPQATNDFDAQDIRMGNMIASAVDRGADPNAAVRMATEALQQPKEISEALERTYNELTKGDTTEVWLADQHSGWWSSPSVGLQVAVEVDRTVRNEFLRNGGNLEAARRTALDMVKTRIAPTEINGTWELMRNAPEQHYKLPWQSNAQASAAIKAEALRDNKGWTDGELTPDKLRVQPYPVKGITAPDGRPVYAIEIQDGAGGWTVQIDMDQKSPTYGMPKPWWPSLAKEKDERKGEVDRAIEAAKARREGDVQLQAGDLGL